MEILPRFEYSRIAHTGLEPYIQDIHLLGESGTATFTAPNARRQQAVSFLREPDIGAFLGKSRYHMLEHLGSS